MYVLNDNISIFDLNDTSSKVMLYNMQTKDTHILNTTSYIILKRCLHESPEEILSYLSNYYNFNEEKQEYIDEIKACIALLVEKGIIYEDNEV